MRRSLSGGSLLMYHTACMSRTSGCCGEVFILCTYAYVHHSKSVCRCCTSGPLNSYTSEETSKIFTVLWASQQTDFTFTVLKNLHAFDMSNRCQKHNPQILCPQPDSLVRIRVDRSLSIFYRNGRPRVTSSTRD